MYQALYRKWRPLVFSDVVGQNQVTDTLRGQVASGRLSHAYLFTGTRGTGKTTCAKILSRAVNCERPQDGDPCNQCAACRGILDGSILDVTEIDAASNNGVDNIRDIREETRYTPANVKKRVYIIDEVHMLSSGAFNALLKTLEEPPEHVLFILATTEIQKVPATILSRCQRFDFRRIAPEVIARRLAQVAGAEGLDLTDGAAALLARLADGAMRDALSLLDRLAMGQERTIDEAAVNQGLGMLSSAAAVELVQNILAQDTAGALARLGQAYGEGKELSALLEQLLGLMRDLLLIRAAGEGARQLIAPQYEWGQLQQLAQGAPAARWTAWAELVQRSLARMSRAASKRIEAEMCLIRLCAGEEEPAAPVKARPPAPARRPALADDEVPPFRYDDPPPPVEDAPPFAVDAPPAPVKEKRASAREKKAEDQPPAAPAGEDAGRWQSLVQKLEGKLSNHAAYVHLKQYATGLWQGDRLVIQTEDFVTQTLLSSAATRAVMEAEASALLGRPVRVSVEEKGEAPAASPLDPILQRAKELDIPVRREE